MIKYLGSKRTLVPRIVALAEAVRQQTGAETAVDLFAGTTRVAQGLKKAGFLVTANDLASYSEILAITFVESDGAGLAVGAGTEDKIAHLNSLPGCEGYFTRTFCEESRYFQPFNGRRVDAIRPEIDRIADGRVERATLLTALMLAADKVDSTTGLQMAYLKSWAPRSFNALELKMPALLAGPGRALREDANALAARLPRSDIAYIDPPYNQHSYFSNYHIWETLIRDDAPEAYGVARKRVDCRDVKSDYNARGRAWGAFEALVKTVPARHLIVSFNDEGFFDFERIARLLEDVHREVVAVPTDGRRYVGAQIGIHDPKGRKVGRVSHLRNTEFLFVAGPGASEVVNAAGFQRMERRADSW